MSKTIQKGTNVWVVDAAFNNLKVPCIVCNKDGARNEGLNRCIYCNGKGSTSNPIFAGYEADGPFKVTDVLQTNEGIVYEFRSLLQQYDASKVFMDKYKAAKAARELNKGLLRELNDGRE